MLRKLIAALAVIAPIGLLVAVGAGPAAAQTRATATQAACSGVVDITHLAFKPSTIPPGGTSTAHLTARNCTGESQNASSTWFGTFTGDNSDCPVIDPLNQAADFAPYGSVKSKVGYEVPSTCRASDLQITVRISENGTVLAQKTADLTILLTPSD
jgi:hypothetical protein